MDLFIVSPSAFFEPSLFVGGFEGLSRFLLHFFRFAASLSLAWKNTSENALTGAHILREPPSIMEDVWGWSDHGGFERLMGIYIRVVGDCPLDRII